MKFIHFSDICIGNPSESGRRWDTARSSELTDSLKNIFIKAEEENAGLVIISGGLFAHVPSTAELTEANDIFRAHPDIETVITAGERDILTESSPVRSFEFSSNVHYVLSFGVERIVLQKLKTEVFAASCCSVTEEVKFSENKRPPILPFRDSELFEAVSDDENDEPVYEEHIKNAAPEEFIKASAGFIDSEAIRIAVMSSVSADDEQEIKRSFRGSEFAYAALGGSLEERECIKNQAYCPGKFEPEDASDTGEHGAMLGEISEETGRLEKISFIPAAGISYITLNIKITPKTSSRELVESVRREFERRGARNIYRLRITGTKNPKEDISLSGLCDEFRINEISDETVPEYDFRELFREHPQDMIGFYISSIVNRKKEMSAIEKKAMYYGIEALLNTADKRTEQ